jgi:hypothetical protein
MAAAKQSTPEILIQVYSIFPFTEPELTCHSDFKVTVKPGNWSLIAGT